MTEKEAKEIIKKIEEYLDNAEMSNDYFMSIIGGKDIISNMCCLCYKCHQLIHFGKNKNINHSEVTKVGQQIAILKGKQIGGVKGVKLTTKKSIIAKEQIKKYSKDFDGTLKDVEVMKIIGIARNTYYKYKKELMSE